MTPKIVSSEALSLDQIARAAQERAEFQHKELQYIRQAYRECRQSYKMVLLESADDESRTLGIGYAMRAFERGETTAQDYLSEIMYAYRVLRDTNQRGRVLRTEIAYRMALAVLFYTALPSSALPRRITPATRELLHQLSELAAALKTYGRWKKRQNSAPVGEIPRAA